MIYWRPLPPRTWRTLLSQGEALTHLLGVHLGWEQGWMASAAMDEVPMQWPSGCAR